MLIATFFLRTLLWTYCIEISVMLFLIRGVFHEKISVRCIIFTGICTTGMTLPYLWFVLPDYLSGVPYLVTGELLVVLIETVIMNQFLQLNLKKALVCSFLVNVASFLFGGIIL